MSRRSAGLDLGVVLLLVAGAFLYWKLQIIGTGGQPEHVLIRASADLYTYIYPNAEAAVRALRGGALPLWNPYQGCGHPLLATVLTGVLYPLNFPYLLLPIQYAIEAVVVLHLGVASVLMYLFTRRIGLNRVGAMAASITFMCSEAIVHAAFSFPPALASAVWLPLAFLGIEQIVERRSFSGAAWLAIAVSMSLLAGWLQTWTYSMYAIGLYSAIRLLGALWSRERPGVLGWKLGLLTAGVLLGVGLTGAQLLPSVELQGLGPRRPGGLTPEQMFIYAPPTPEQFVAGVVAPVSNAPLYLGILAPVLIPLAALAAAGRRRTLGFGCVALVGILLGLTIHTPVYDWFQALPTARWFRVPQRILYLYAFGGSLLVGVGLDEAARAHAQGPWRRLAAPGIASVSALGIALGAPVPLRGLIALAAGVVLLWLVAWLPAPRLRAGLLAGVLALSSWDLVHAHSPVGMRSYLDLGLLDREKDLFEFIRERQQFNRTYLSNSNAWLWAPMMHKQGVLREVYVITDYEPLSLDRTSRFFALLEEPDVQPPVQTFSGHLSTRPGHPHFRLLDLMSVRYIVVSAVDTQGRIGLTAAGWRAVFAPRGRDHLVFENPRPLPRAYAVHDVLPASGEEVAFEALRTPSFDFRRSVVIEADAELRPLRVTSQRPITPATIVEYAADRVVIDVSNEAPGYLVLTDTFYPGWKAFVDGAPAPILRANFLFRGVPLGAGRHQVTFSYEPTSFAVGSALSLASLALFVAGAATACWRRRARAGEENGPGPAPRGL